MRVDHYMHSREWDEKNPRHCVRWKNDHSFASRHLHIVSNQTSPFQSGIYSIWKYFNGSAIRELGEGIFFFQFSCKAISICYALFQSWFFFLLPLFAHHYITHIYALKKEEKGRVKESKRIRVKTCIIVSTGLSSAAFPHLLLCPFVVGERTSFCFP